MATACGELGAAREGEASGEQGPVDSVCCSQEMELRALSTDLQILRKRSSFIFVQ